MSSSSPRLNEDSPPAGSTSRLVLLPNTDDPDPLQDYATDDEDDSEDDDPQTNPLPVPPLPRSVVFLYLLSPYLRLGAVYASDIGNTPLTYGFTGLVTAASLSAFCRQIWFLLGRYLRKSFTEDIFVHMFARRHRKVRKHGLARYTFTIISGLFRVLLAAMYLRESVDSALRLKIELIPSLSRINVSIALSILVFVLSLPRSLASRSLVYATSFSVASYLAWTIAISRIYVASRPSPPNLNSFPRGVLWNEISSIVFACTTTMTVPLSASLIAGTPSVSPASRNKRARSFQLLNTLSTVLAVILIFPIVAIAALPRAPATKPVPDNLVLVLRIAILVLSIPSHVVSITLLPLYGAAYQLIRSDLALSIITLVILGLSMVPPTTASILDDVTLFLAVSGTFLLPALAHIAIHYFRRPLSIVVPQEPSSVADAPRPDHFERSPSPSRDPLLQRKERLLQRRRWGRRLLWDVLAWLILVPANGYALVWAIGRLAQRW